MGKQLGVAVQLAALAGVLVVSGQAAYRIHQMQTRQVGDAGAGVTNMGINAPNDPSQAESRSRLDRYLLIPGADVNLRMQGNGYTALMIGAERGDRERVNALLQAGANPTLQSWNDGGALSLAARSGKAEVVRQLLKAKPSLKNSEGERALSLAIAKEHPDVAKVLLQNGIDPNTQIDREGRLGDIRILRRAVAKNRFDLVKLLLDAGANPNLPDNDPHPVLLSALLGESEGKATSVINFQPLDNTRIRIARLLIERGANPNGKSRHNGTTVLTAAIAKAPADVTKLLLKKRAKVNIAGAYEQTPLMYAVERESLEHVNLLLNAKANVNATQAGVQNRSALLYAVEKGNVGLVKLLLEKGANVNVVSSASQLKANRSGLRYYKLTPLDKAQELKLTAIAHLLERYGGKPYARLQSTAQLDVS